MQKVELWYPACHDVRPTSKKLVSFSLHGGRGGVQEDGVLVAEETELL